MEFKTSEACLPSGNRSVVGLSRSLAIATAGLWVGWSTSRRAVAPWVAELGVALGAALEEALRVDWVHHLFPHSEQH